VRVTAKVLPKESNEIWIFGGFSIAKNNAGDEFERESRARAGEDCDRTLKRSKEWLHKRKES
jgi:hypothetical protein